MVLSVKRLTREGKFVDISFDLRAGEIVGLAGLVGAGRTEIAEAIFGIERYDAGSVELAGQSLKNGSPSAAMSAGIALVPEDRRQHGLVMEESIEHNVVLASLASVTRRGLIAAGVSRERSRLLAGAAAGQVRPPVGLGLDALGRQPAEGRAGQMAEPHDRG